MPVLLKHGAKHIATSASQRSFPRADSNLSRQSSRPTVVSAGSRLTSAGSNLLNEVRRRSRHATFSQRIRNPKECLKALKQFTRKYHLKYLVPLFVVMIYMFVGALLFLWLESAAEEKRINNRIREYDREVELLVKRIEEIATDQAAQRAPVRRRFVREALDWFHKQVDLKPQLEPEWSLTSAMYFSGTIFTTIGFGDIACETAVGRILTVLYAVVGWLNGKRLSSMLTLGIPIMLITLNDLGKFCYKSINDFIFACGRRWFWLRSCFRREPPSKDHLLEMETGNGGLNVEESTHRVSFNLRPASEELTLNLETYGDNDEPPTMRTLSVEDPTGHSIEPIPVLRQRSETAENSIDMLSGGDFNAEDELLIPSGPPPRMSVLTALSVTMSTIGLGDVNVKRRDFMVLCFLIVIIGLSLVSMTIAVIQQSLEELYKKLLMKLLLEYQAKLASGDHKGASMGLMKSFGSSKAAKYLLPMISADTRRNVMVQIQEVAKETGIELPPIFEDLDAKTGMPKILVVAQEVAANKDLDASIVDSIVRQTDPTRISMPSRTPGPNVVYYDSSSQTDEKTFEDKNHQTLGIQTDELAVQTDYATSVEETQTYNAEMRENETMTTVSSYESNEVQTEMVTTMEQELQTYVVDLIENESQTEIVETKNERIQTPYPETFAVEVQTEDGDMGEPFKGPSRITQARRRIQKAFKSRSTKTPDSTEEKPEMSEWKDVSDGDNLSHSSKESLDWDPVDGLHAEKQRPVKDLKRFFDKSRAKKK
ncbi:Potassium channel subfamily K member 18 [Aphelenchoides besseyi]|nr:Potassium channel subfamily K member 18 [Aphelenchoides besseyi]